MSKILNRVFLKIVFLEIDHYNSEGLKCARITEFPRSERKLGSRKMMVTSNWSGSGNKRAFNAITVVGHYSLHFALDV